MGLAALLTDHRAPFHRRARTRPPDSESPPTAQACRADPAATAYRTLLVLPVPGSGLATLRHLVPFQCSIRVPVGPVPCWREPTAQMLRADIAAPPFSSSFPVPGSGEFTTRHVDPFQCSISVCSGPSPCASLNVC